MLDSRAIVNAIRNALCRSSRTNVEATLPGVIAAAPRWINGDLPRDVLASAVADLAVRLEEAAARISRGRTASLPPCATWRSPASSPCSS